MPIRFSILVVGRYAHSTVNTCFESRNWNIAICSRSPACTSLRSQHQNLAAVNLQLRMYHYNKYSRDR